MQQVKMSLISQCGFNKEWLCKVLLQNKLSHTNIVTVLYFTSQSLCLQNSVK